MAATTPQYEPGRIPLQHRLARRLRRLSPLLVWVSIVIVAATLYGRRESGVVLAGYAHSDSYRVAAESGGRLQRLEVRLDDEVTRGQIVAVLADDELRLQLREARAELDQLAAELFEHSVDRLTDLRRFARDAANAHIEYLTALTDQAEDRITLQGLELTLGRTQQLEANELTAEASLDADRVACEAVRERIAGREKTLAALRQAQRDAEARYDAFLAVVPDEEPAADALGSALTVQEVRIEMADLAIARQVLRAPADGRVAAIDRRAGEVIAAGQTVLTIVDPAPAELVAYLPERRIHDVHAGDPVKVRRLADPRHEFTSAVAHVGAGVERLPLRAVPSETVPQWGLAVHIPVPASLEATPGEAFEISFR